MLCATAFGLCPGVNRIDRASGSGIEVCVLIVVLSLGVVGYTLGAFPIGENGATNLYITEKLNAKSTSKI